MVILSLSGNRKATLTFRITLFCMTLSIFSSIFLVADANAAESEGMVIGKIETAGNFYISTAKIIATIRTREGQIFNAVIVEEDVKRIAELKGIEYAYYNTEIANGKVNLTFVVVEKKAVRSVTFSGNKKYSY